MIRRQDPPQRSRGGHDVNAMYVDTATVTEDDESTAYSNNMTVDDATLFAMLKASGPPALLKGEVLCHSCLGWGHPAKEEWQARLPVCCQASPARGLHRRRSPTSVSARTPQTTP
eukprot:2501840-Pleurochrysis_carterae.AAC.1